MREILIIDDECVFCQFLQLALELEGYTVHVAYGGNDALQVLPDLRPDLILLDLCMPQISGWEVLDSIRRDERLCTIPVVLITALADEVTRRTGERKRVEGFLTKPLAVDEIVKVVRQHLPDSY